MATSGDKLHNANKKSDKGKSSSATYIAYCKYLQDKECAYVDVSDIVGLDPKSSTDFDKSKVYVMRYLADKDTIKKDPENFDNRGWDGCWYEGQVSKLGRSLVALKEIIQARRPSFPKPVRELNQFEENLLSGKDTIIGSTAAAEAQKQKRNAQIEKKDQKASTKESQMNSIKQCVMQNCETNSKINADSPKDSTNTQQIDDNIKLPLVDNDPNYNDLLKLNCELELKISEMFDELNKCNKDIASKSELIKVLKAKIDNHEKERQIYLKINLEHQVTISKLQKLQTTMHEEEEGAPAVLHKELDRHYIPMETISATTEKVPSRPISPAMCNGNKELQPVVLQPSRKRPVESKKPVPSLTSPSTIGSDYSTPSTSKQNVWHKIEEPPAKKKKKNTASSGTINKSKTTRKVKRPLIDAAGGHPTPMKEENGNKHIINSIWMSSTVFDSAFVRDSDNIFVSDLATNFYGKNIIKRSWNAGNQTLHPNSNTIPISPVKKQALVYALEYRLQHLGMSKDLAEKNAERIVGTAISKFTNRLRSAEKKEGLPVSRNVVSNESPIPHTEDGRVRGGRDESDDSDSD